VFFHAVLATDAQAGRAVAYSEGPIEMTGPVPHGAVTSSPRDRRSLGTAYRCRHADANVIAGRSTMVSADHFAHELRAQLKNAAAQGATTIVITSDKLCQSIPWGNRSTHACCEEAMQRGAQFGDVVLVDQTGGAGMTIRYWLPRSRL
jgi:hypothetical protein